MPHRLPKQLTLREAFLFPVSTAQARLDVLTGGVLFLFLLPLGWVLNLGNRLNVVARLYVGEQPVFRGFSPWTYTLRRGCISFATICCYLSPAAATGALAVAMKLHGYEKSHLLPAALSAALFVLGVFTLPGCMTVFACERDATVLRSPVRAFQRAWRQRGPYLKAWAIALAAVSLSTLGIFALGFGFAFTSVWAWEVVGYAFTVAMYVEP